MRQLSRVIATVCGIGHAPIAPGTWGSLAGMGLWYVWHPTVAMQWVVCGILLVIGLITADITAKNAGAKDPSCVVIDEVAGMWIALIGLPQSMPIAVAAFLLFRLFDIAKWPPMKQLERLPGGLGIMADDLAAGILARLIIGWGLVWLGG